VTETPVQVPLTAPRDLDRAAVVELMANARDNIHRDFGRGGIVVLATALAAFTLADLTTALIAGAVVTWPTMHLALRSAIRRRRRRCVELGVDPAHVDRVFQGVDLFEHVVGWNGLPEDVRAQLVDDIVAGRYVRRREHWE
jgi:hypothetical protein